MCCVGGGHTLSPTSKVPASYIKLQEKIAQEVEKCARDQKPPVLNQKEFAALAKSIPNCDIVDPEELSLGECVQCVCMWNQKSYHWVSVCSLYVCGTRRAITG